MQGLKQAVCLLNSCLLQSKRCLPSRSRPRRAVAAMAFTYQPPVVSEPRDQHTSTLVMIHGLGDSGHGWADVASLWAQVLPNTKFVFPNAPMRPITLNGGMRMPGWYDILSLEKIDAEEDVEGVEESVRYVEGLVRAEAAAVGEGNVVVSGFSQGGAIALAMLRSDLKLAGVVGLSTYLPMATRRPLFSPANVADRKSVV